MLWGHSYPPNLSRQPIDSALSEELAEVPVLRPNSVGAGPWPDVRYRSATVRDCSYGSHRTHESP